MVVVPLWNAGVYLIHHALVSFKNMHVFFKYIGARAITIKNMCIHTKFVAF
jgi:hypothetical protein